MDAFPQPMPTGPAGPSGDGPTPVPRVSTLRDRLRADTAEAHRRVDDAFGGLDLASRGGLATFLLAHERAFRAVERRCAGTPFEPPAMSGLLRADLARLGLAPTGDLAAELDADPLGAAYVVSGAHYGARVLRRRVAASHDAGVRECIAYLGSDAMAAHWKRLSAALRERPAQGRNADEVVEGARATFGRFAAELERVGK